MILNIETATNVCSVCLSEEGNIIAQKISYEDKSHSELLTVFVEQIVAEKNIELKNLDAIAVSMGPGSYTGLRIGVSAAKGIAYATEKPLIAVSTLQTMVKMVLDKHKISADAILCPMIDARRMEVYTALFAQNGLQTREIEAEIIDENSFAEILNTKEIYFFGNGANKCKQTITHPNAKFIDNIYPQARYMAEISAQKLQNRNFEDVAYFEPFYLKNFIATKPKKLIPGL